MKPDNKIESLMRQLNTRQGRKKSPYCLCEGVRCCEELIARTSDAVVYAVLRDDISIDLPENVIVYNAGEKWFDQFAPTVQSQGVILVVKRPDFLNNMQPSNEPYIIVLDQINDPGNIGTIFRTAVASGVKELWLTKGCCDPFSDKAIRSAISIQFSLNLRQFDSLTQAIEMAPLLGYANTVYLTSPHEGKSVFTTPDLFDKTLIVFGNEANGIIQKPTEACQWVTIPMPGREESLNVAQAATIFLFEAVRRSSN